MKNFLLVILAICLSITKAAYGDGAQITVVGVGKVPIGTDISLSRDQSFEAAKQNAVANAIDNKLGANTAEDPAVQDKLASITQQVTDDMVVNQDSNRDGSNNYVTTVTLQMDEAFFTELIQNAGIANSGNASSTANQYRVLAIMDEYFTTPTDQQEQKPLKEVVNYHSDQSSSSDFKANFKAHNADQENGSLYANDGGGAAIRDSLNGASSASAAGSASGSDQKTDVVDYNSLIEYQPKNVGPADQNFTYAQIVEVAQQFDLTIVDNSVIKSQYFRGKPMSLNQLQNAGTWFDYIDKAAKASAKADYVMLGNSIIVDNGRNAETGECECDGMVTVNTFSTRGGESIGTDIQTESAFGNSPDQCRAAVAKKMGEIVGSNVSHRIANYAKLREMYGQAFNVELDSLRGHLTGRIADTFLDALDAMPGRQGRVVERGRDKNSIQVTVTYKGDKGFTRDFNTATANMAVFSNMDSTTSGNNIRFCLEGTCP
jgi:hypothetical protein